MKIYHLVPTVDDKKHYVGVFDQKIKNYGLWFNSSYLCLQLRTINIK